ncbi:MAG: NACHT domain-containing protein, partial [Planctomycetota bacterium]|nr:NACHT domain-containing protein [Planctomycetota bacterium]
MVKSKAASIQHTVKLLFNGAEKRVPPDGSLPGVVLKNRRKRAEDRIQQALRSRGSKKVPRDLTREIKSLVTRWAGKSFGDGFDEVEQLEIRCAQERDLVVAEESGDSKKILKAFAKDYRRRVIRDYGRFEIQGLQTSERVLLDLDRVYVPLHLEVSPEAVSEDAPEGVLLIGTRVPVTQLLKEHQRLLIIGVPGSGKSTLVAYLAAQLAQGNLSMVVGWHKEALPFVLTVRTFEDGAINLRSIARMTGCELKLVSHSFRNKQAVLFVDGLDEAPPKRAEEVLASLRRLSKSHPAIPILVTSRPVESARELKEKLPGFSSAEIAAFNR